MCLIPALRPSDLGRRAEVEAVDPHGLRADLNVGHCCDPLLVPYPAEMWQQELFIRCDRPAGEDRVSKISVGVPVHARGRSEEHTSELQSLAYLVCRLLLEKKKKKNTKNCLSLM